MLLDVTQCLVVIVGGGTVAVRKARGLIEAGATRIDVVAPQIHAEMPVGVRRVAERFQAAHVDGARLVFAATDVAEVNSAVVEACRMRGILVNRADYVEGNGGDFTTPAIERRGPILIAVSASGAPALAANLREKLAGHIEPRWIQMAEAMMILRPRILSGRLLPAERRDTFQELATDTAMQLLAERGLEGLWKWLLEKHPGLA
jgi:precorrin-2 dehydrogenase/sirohydrochlorin ferrochelatase